MNIPKEKYMGTHLNECRINTFGLLAAVAACLMPGCASQQDVTNCQIQVDNLRTEVIRLRGELESHVKLIKQKNERLVEFEKLKVAREQKVAALQNIAETLAAARAWESEFKQFKDHCDLNHKRHMAIVSKMQSPADARSIAPTEGHEPYSGSFEKAYASLLPSAKAEVLGLLDNERDRKKVKEYCDYFTYEINRAGGLESQRSVAFYEAVTQKVLRCDYPGLGDTISIQKVFRAFGDYKIDTDTVAGPTSEELRRFDLR